MSAAVWDYPPPPLLPLPGGRDWLVTADYARPSHSLRRTLKIRGGFISDLASVPFWALPLVPKWGQHGPGVLFHDWITRRPDLFPDVTRRQADEVLVEFAEADGTSSRDISLLWAGVRAGGWYAWRKNRRSNTHTKRKV